MKNSINFKHQHGPLLDKGSTFSIKDAYRALYRLAGANEENHFIFTSSGAEAVNHAVLSAYIDVTRQTGKNHFIASALSEMPALMAMSRLRQLGCVFQTAHADEKGYISVETLAETITPRTAMVSLSLGDGLTGVLQPIHAISELCKDRGILLHIDASHVLGKGIYPFEAGYADFMTFNGEQIQAPAGTGGMFIRGGLEISPFILGGEEQAGMRGGGFDESSLKALGYAAKEALIFSDHLCLESARLRDSFERGIREHLPSSKPLFSHQERLPNISVLLFPGVFGESLAYLLHQKGLSASFGGGNFQSLPSILKACGIPKPLCYCGLSFAFSKETSEDEIERGVALISESVSQLQRMSPSSMESVS